MTTFSEAYDTWVSSTAESMADAAALRRARFSLDGGAPFTFGEFIHDNPELDLLTLVRIKGLQIGGSMVLGGGAAAEFTIRREPSVYHPQD